MLLNILFLFVLSTLLQMGSTDVVAELHVHGIVGESVHLQCIVSDSRSITRVYFQKEGEKEAIFLNGFERSPVSDSVKAYVKDYVNRTVVDRTRMSMELLHISLADEGVYTCVAFYEPKPHVVLHNDTVIHLNVTANYSVPEISIDRCSDGPTPQSSKICVFSCSSSGGFPLKNINWFVSEHKNSLLRENGDGVNVRDPVSGVWNVSQSVTLNCSQPVNISCSVGGAVSELLHVCLDAPSDSHPDWLVFVVGAVLLLITFIIAVVLIKRRRTQQHQAESAEMENLNRTSNGV